MSYIIVAIHGDSLSSAEELEEACRTLVDDLLDVPDIQIGRVVDPTPTAGTRSVVADAAAALVVSGLAARGVAKSALNSEMVLEVFKAWLKRNKSNQMEITLPDGTNVTMSGEVDGADAARILQQIGTSTVDLTNEAADAHDFDEA